MTLSSSVPLMLSEAKGDCRSPGADSCLVKTEKNVIRKNFCQRKFLHFGTNLLFLLQVKCKYEAEDRRRLA